METKIKMKKNSFEKMAWEKNRYVCGIDEVGRGCLAGPVVVTATITPQNTSYRLLRDSKVMTEAQREEAYAWITANCFYATAMVNHRLIDHYNIYTSTLLAMKKAYLALIAQLPFSLEHLEYVLVDAMPLKLDASCGHEKLEIHHFPYGETYSTSIAAASIVAKVTRDRLMKKLSPLLPLYDFAEHKGYATEKHITALLAHGSSIIHRKTFVDTVYKHQKQKDNQLTLFGGNHE